MEGHSLQALCSPLHPGQGFAITLSTSKRRKKPEEKEFEKQIINSSSLPSSFSRPLLLYRASTEIISQTQRNNDTSCFYDSPMILDFSSQEESCLDLYFSIYTCNLQDQICHVRNCVTRTKPVPLSGFQSQYLLSLFICLC